MLSGGSLPRMEVNCARAVYYFYWILITYFHHRCLGVLADNRGATNLFHQIKRTPWKKKERKWRCGGGGGLLSQLSWHLLPWAKKIETTVHTEVQARARSSMHAYSLACVAVSIFLARVVALLMNDMQPNSLLYQHRFDHLERIPLFLNKIRNWFESPSLVWKVCSAFETSLQLSSMFRSSLHSILTSLSVFFTGSATPAAATTSKKPSSWYRLPRLMKFSFLRHGSSPAVRNDPKELKQGESIFCRTVFPWGFIFK